MSTDAAARRPRINILAVMLCCLAGTLPAVLNGLVAPGIAMAAEEGDMPTEESGNPTKDAPAQSEASKNGEDGPLVDEPTKPDADESEEIFVPSEDISEDIDVPFPVDI